MTYKTHLVRCPECGLWWEASAMDAEDATCPDCNDEDDDE